MAARAFNKRGASCERLPDIFIRSLDAGFGVGKDNCSFDGESRARNRWERSSARDVVNSTINRGIAHQEIHCHFTSTEQEVSNKPDEVHDFGSGEQ